MATLSEKLKKISPQRWALSILIVIGLVGLIMMTFKTNPKIVKAAQQVPQLAAAIRQKFQVRSDYRGLNTEEVIKLKAAPTDMMAGNALMNALDLPVLVGNGADGAPLMPGARRFNIVYKGLNKSECVSIATYNSNEKDQLGLNDIVILSEKHERAFSWGGENPLPVSLSEAEDSCGKENILIFGYE